MPELPEVETIRRDLSGFVLNKKIKSVDLLLARLVKSNPKQFVNILKNNSFTEIQRIGKLLIFKLQKTPNSFLLVHLRMTGQLIYCSKKNIIAGGHGLPKIKNCTPSKYSYIIFNFQDKSRLFFNDMRTFGALKIVNSFELHDIINKYGIEPLQSNFKLKTFKETIKRRTINIKALLLNQNLIAGIGNIYADEILFRAGVLPDKTSKNLNDSEIKKIFRSCQLIIKKAIKQRGTTFNNYVDVRGKKGSYAKKLKVYGQGGKKCLKCKTNTLVKTKVAGRGTVYCPGCQK